jgi:hypothetical protein
MDWLIDYAPVYFWPVIYFGAGWMTAKILRELQWSYEPLPEGKGYNAMIWVSIILGLLSLVLQWLLNKPALNPAQKKALGVLRNRMSKVEAACEQCGAPMLPDDEADAAAAEMHA